MNVLFIAYSCCPNSGSENKIGWNIPIETCKKEGNNVFVITKEEHRKEIERYLNNSSLNIHFYFIGIPEIYKIIFNGAFYSGRLNIWHKRAEKLAKKICKEKSIQIIHQITPIEFRAIGNYGNIPNVKFICGPLGGGESMPEAFSSYLGNKERLIEIVRRVVNSLYRTRLKHSKRLSKCSYIMCANKETFEYLNSVGGNNYKIFFDNGLDEKEIIGG